MSTTYEEVSHCPRCDQVGESKRGGRLAGGERGSSSIQFWCRNNRCRWYNTSWIVQVRADGTFPDAVKKRPKHFHQLPYNNSIVPALEELQYAMTQPGAEMRR